MRKHFYLMAFSLALIIAPAFGTPFKNSAVHCDVGKSITTTPIEQTVDFTQQNVFILDDESSLNSFVICFGEKIAMEKSGDQRLRHINRERKNKIAKSAKWKHSQKPSEAVKLPALNNRRS